MSWEPGFLAVTQVLGASAAQAFDQLAEPGARRMLTATFGPGAPRKTRALALAGALHDVGLSVAALGYSGKDFT
jgi:hypothetical protein